MLDIRAAELLSQRGVDTGFVSSVDSNANEEYFPEFDDCVVNIAGNGLKKIVCKDGAKVLSQLVPDNTPSAYLYENADGLKFLVLAIDIYEVHHGFKPNFFNSYFRQAQLIEGIEWVGGKKLPAVCVKNPNLYMVASKNEKAMSVALANIFLDDIFEPVITLDKEYSEIKFVNCTGRLEGDMVYLSDIPPYGFVAFEVK